MPQSFANVDVLREGDAQGNRMIVRFTTNQGSIIHSIGVPQDWPSRTGPTWAYLFESDGLTLLDPGAHGSYEELSDGIVNAGFAVKDIDRIVISHGHSDHDGSIARAVGESDAGLWAHGVYASLLPYNPWEVQNRSATELHAEMARIADAGADRRSSSTYQARNKTYLESRKNLKVDHAVTDAEQFGGTRVIYAPGHSPDELCLAFDGVVFTGDHVLPEITPHPTMKATYRDHVKEGIPEEYRDASGSFGLERYMRSLKTILDLGPEYSILPAHRLYNRNKFNLTGVERAEEVIRHHARRMAQILQRISNKPTGLESITRAIFERGKLIGGNLYMALSEMVAHVELLFDLGDLELNEDRQLVRTGHENYRQFIDELTA